MRINLPFKFEMLITSFFIGLYYSPNNYTPGGLISKKIFIIRIPFTKIPDDCLGSK